MDPSYEDLMVMCLQIDDGSVALGKYHGLQEQYLRMDPPAAHPNSPSVRPAAGDAVDDDCGGDRSYLRAGFGSGRFSRV
ncbi:yjeF-related protein [Pyricularia oryzae]|nr:yjeF-related protein [Pyricularia oryzae]KAI7930459.1 yjeF-related protein [Pyricularia oryzae]